MGLDMYLHGKRYISEHFDEGDTARAVAIQKLFPELADRTVHWRDTSPVNEVQIEAGYWRKANAIHAWFVKHCQNGNDDCGNYHVSRDQLLELKLLCEKVLDFGHLAVECLPVQSGFFFGSDAYDELYFNELKKTVQIIDDCLALPTSWKFVYQSSW